MQAKFIALIAAVLAFALTATTSAQDSCRIPSSLASALATKYPDARVMTLNDLPQQDREFFEKDHGPDCPGLIRVNFYGDGKATWALVLIIREMQKQDAQLVIAHEIAGGFEFTPLDNANQESAVVWRLGPGTYADIETAKTIRAAHPVIVFAGYESWAILYAWNGKRVEKIWLAD